MKKMLICCGALCMTLALFCGTALAKMDVTKDDASVTVTAETDDQGVKVTVAKDSGVEAGQLYLVMIQGGDKTELPNEQNLYYLDVTKAETTSYNKVARPKSPMDNGEYTVFLSDYAANNGGGRKAVATITVSEDDPTPVDPTPVDPTPGDVLYGDVDGNGKVKSWDATVLACYLAGQSEFQNINEKNADCDANGKVRSWDLTILYCYLAGQSEFAELPHTGN